MQSQCGDSRAKTKQTEKTERLMKSKHAEKLLSSLDWLRAWEWICDFTIKVENESFSVHRAVLAASSKHFFEKLKSKDGGIGNGILEVSNMSANTVKQCVEFMYTGGAILTTETIYDIISAAEEFKLNDLTDLCLEFLSQNLTIENCFRVKGLYEKYGCTEKNKKLESFLLEKFDFLISANGFLTLDSGEMTTYLTTSNLDHELIWKAIKNWIFFRENERKKHYILLLSLYTEKFPINFMFDAVWPDPLTISSKPAKELLGKVILSDIEKFKSALTIKNCFQAKALCEITKHTNSSEGHNQTRLFMMKHFEDICEREELLSLSKDEIFQIFRSPKTKYSSEITKWNVALNWTNHDLTLRKKHFPNLLAAIKLSNLPLDFIQDVVRPEKLVQESDKCKDMILDAFYAFANPESKNSSSQNSKVSTDSENDASPKSPHAKSSDKRAARVSISLPSGSKRQQKIDTLLSPSKKARQQTDIPIIDLASPEVTSSTDQSYLAVFDKNTGKIKGLNLANTLWKDIAITKVTKDAFQGIISFQNVLYLIKGSDLFRFNRDKKSWDKLASKSRKPLSWSVMAVCENCIFVLQDGCLDYYVVDKNKWIENSSFASLSEGFCACVLSDDIFTVGGSVEPTRARKYKTTTKIISNIEPMMTGRKHCAAVTLNGKVYVMGGAVDLQFSQSAESYDPVADMWTAVSNMQMKRSRLTACSYGEKIYAIGGSLPHDEKIDSVEVYEITKERYRWRILHRMLKMSDSITACVVDMPNE